MNCLELIQNRVVWYRNTRTIILKARTLIAGQFKQQIMFVRHLGIFCQTSERLNLLPIDKIGTISPLGANLICPSRFFSEIDNDEVIQIDRVRMDTISTPVKSWTMISKWQGSQVYR